MAGVDRSRIDGVGHRRLLRHMRASRVLLLLAVGVLWILLRPPLQLLPTLPLPLHERVPVLDDLRRSNRGAPHCALARLGPGSVEAARGRRQVREVGELRRARDLEGCRGLAAICLRLCLRGHLRGGSVAEVVIRLLPRSLRLVPLARLASSASQVGRVRVEVVPMWIWGKKAHGPHSWKRPRSKDSSSCPLQKRRPHPRGETACTDAASLQRSTYNFVWRCLVEIFVCAIEAVARLRSFDATSGRSPRPGAG